MNLCNIIFISFSKNACKKLTLESALDFVFSFSVRLILSYSSLLWIVEFVILYFRTTKYCLNLATEQEKSVTEKWLPELRTAVMSAQKSMEDCKYVRGLVRTRMPI